MRFFAALLAVVVLAGCGNYATDNFSKPGISESQKASDDYYCQQYAEANTGVMMGGLVGVGDHANQRKANYSTCMMDRGYTYTP